MTKLTQSHLNDLAQVYFHQTYNHETKEAAILLLRRLARYIAEQLNLPKGDFEIRVNRGGIAVPADVYLHTTKVYMNFAPSCCGRTFYWRTCDGLKDYGCAMKHFNRSLPMFVTMHDVRRFIDEVAKVAYPVVAQERTNEYYRQLTA
jgi:hypothetical protein